MPQTALYLWQNWFKISQSLTRKTYTRFVWSVAVFTALRSLCSEFETDTGETTGSIRVWHAAAADSLPSDTVTAVIQTRDGFLWIGTSEGLARFDGAKFTKVNGTGSPTNGLKGVTALCEDSDGHLWIGTQKNGLFELAQGKLLSYEGRPALVAGAVTSLAADERKQVWIGGSSGLSLWTGEHFQSFGQRDGLPDEYVSSVNVAHSGTVWITTRVGMCRILDGRIVPYEFQTESQGRSPEYLGAYEDQRGNLWAFGDTYLINLTENRRFNYFRSSEPRSVRIWSLCEGRDGRLWIGTSGRGLFCFEDKRFQPVSFGEQRWPYDVRAICEDREGNLWLGTSGGGLVQLRPQSVRVLRFEQGLPENPPTALALDAAGRIYVGLQRGGLFVGEAGRFDRIAGGSGLALENSISSLCVARDGTVWAGTLGDGVYGWRNGRTIQLSTADGLASDSVVAVCVDRQGDVWASTSAGTIQRLAGPDATHFDAGLRLPGTAVTAMIPTTPGLWLGTIDGQILREESGTVIAVGAANVPGSHPVLALCEDKAKRLWAGTAGGGLICLANGVVRIWTAKEGLPSEIVPGVVDDGATNLWLSTGAGIYRVDYGDSQNLLDQPQPPLSCRLVWPIASAVAPQIAFGGTRAALAPGGHIWFATPDGVVEAAPQTGIEPSAFPVYIESVTVNGQAPLSLLHAGPWSPPTRKTEQYQTPLDLKSLEIRFTAVSFAAPEDVRFRHKLEGSDSEWVEDSAVRYARYGRLARGDYRFRVEARNAGGFWQDAGETFSFVVPTPFYFQTWAICLYAIAAIGLVAGVVRGISHQRLRLALVRLEQQQSLERERMRIARDMHDEMGSKLTKISFLSEHIQIDTESLGPLAGKIQSIAQASRDLLQTMDEIVWVVNPHNDTLENLVAYLSHYAVEYFQNTPVECEMPLPQDLPHYALSSEARHNLFLTFQEALNNVLKHSGASKVKVEMTVTPLECEFKIVDNGKGFEVPARTEPVNVAHRGGNGLRNMRQRMKTIGGDCLVHSRPGAGTTVRLRMRLAK